MWRGSILNSHLQYIETYDLFLGPDGKVRAELFGPDQLHYNADYGSFRWPTACDRILRVS